MYNNFSPEIKSSNTSFKNLYKDDNTGKIIVTDCNNNKYESDIFGRKLKKFLPKITGVIPGSAREKIILKKNKNHSTFPSNNNIINESITHREKLINYLPTIKRFEGFSSFPRPISLPFYNIPDFLIKNNLKKKMNKEAIKFYKKENKINIINKQNNDNRRILSYLTKDLNEYSISNKDKEKLLDLVDKNIDELKEDYKIKLNAIYKNPNYIALNQFKKKILLTKKQEQENNNKLNEPPIEIKKKYKIMHNLIENISPNKKNKSIQIKENLFINKYLKKKIKDKNKNKSNTSSIDSKKEKNYRKINLINNKYKNENIIIGPDKLNNIFRSKDFGVGRSIKMDFGNYSYEEAKNKLPKIDNVNNTEMSQDKENESYLPKISNNIMNKNNSKENLYQDKDTAETVSNMNRNNTEIKMIDERIEDDELSFISRENETETKRNKNTNIRTNKYMNQYCQHEKELLKGIRVETPKEEVEIPPSLKKKVLKNNGQLYRENLALLKLTNPAKFKLIEQKDEYDMKLLIKKLGRNRKKMETKDKV